MIKKKQKLNLNLRIFLIGITIILTGVMIFLLYTEVSNPGFEEKKTVLYNYNNKALIDYEVFLKPNIIYDNNSLGEEDTYISAFVKNIKTEFNYEFSGEREAQIKGEYNIVAVVEGFISGDEKNKTIWKKIFTMVPKTNFEEKSKKIAIKKEILISLDKYNYFIEQVFETSKLNTQIKLSVLMNVNLKANTDKGLIEENFTPAVTFPLDTSYFEIVKNEVEEKPGAIEEIKKVQIPVDTMMVAIYSFILCLLMAALIFIIFFTTTEKDPIIRNINKIFKKHGSRLVALDSEIVVKYDESYKVKLFDDLVKIADDLEKPIMYKYSQDIHNINKFYVFSDHLVYVFNISNYFDKTVNKKNVEKEVSIKNNSNSLKERAWKSVGYRKDV